MKTIKAIKKWWIKINRTKDGKMDSDIHPALFMLLVILLMLFSFLILHWAG